MALRSFSSVESGSELPEQVYSLTRGDLVNYSGVTGDPNPIHFSDTVVKMVGLQDVVAQGMLTMGLGAGYVSDWLGDPAFVKEYSVRFTSPAFVPADAKAELVFSGKLKSVDSETKTGQIAITAKQDGRKIFGRAVAVVQFG